MPREKILWVVHYDSLTDFANTAVEVGATGVAIRTDNNVKAAIQVFHDRGIQVYGWRWPSAKQDSAMHEADVVADLYNAKLDGYFVDVEGEPGKSYDWNQNGLQNVAEKFCAAVKSAGGKKPFGVTSHFLAAAIFPKLPWATFFSMADLYLPQAYWRVDGGIVKHGDPVENYQLSLDAWKKCGADLSRIVPMAGELAHITGAEIDQYAKKAAELNIATHFYTYGESISQDVRNAIKRA